MERCLPARPQARQRSTSAVSRRSAPESRHSSLIFGAQSEIIRWTWIDARYLRAYGKSKHSQDTDRASTCAAAINQKGTFRRGSAFAEGQDRTIDQPVPETRSSLAECIASSCGRSPTTFFPPELRAFLPRLSRRAPRTRHVSTMKSEASDVATPGARSTWKSWVIVAALGLLALVSPYINPQTVKPKVTALPAQTD